MNFVHDTEFRRFGCLIIRIALCLHCSAVSYQMLLEKCCLCLTLTGLTENFEGAVAHIVPNCTKVNFLAWYAQVSIVELLSLVGGV